MRRVPATALSLSLSLGVVSSSVVALGGEAHADDLPAPRLVPELSLSKDKGVESAPPAADSWTTRPRTVSIFGGAPGSPLGIAGVTFEYAPIKYVVLGAGGGYSPDGGLRGSFMPRLRLPLNRWFAVGLGFPVTLGPYEYSVLEPKQCDYAGCSVGGRTTRSWSLAGWGQLEPNVEFRLNSAIALRLYAGYAHIINRSSDSCTSSVFHGCPSRIGEQKTYGGLALGYAW